MHNCRVSLHNCRVSLHNCLSSHTHTHVGDYMPDDKQLVIPRRWKYEEYEECKESLGADAGSLSYFCTVLREAPELAHIVYARFLLNFQGCKTCIPLHDNVMVALKSGDKVALAAAKAKRTVHFREQRAERLSLYTRVAWGRDPTQSTLSMIIDKWDSNKTSVPFFARSMTWWQTTKHHILEQHVVGVLIHGVPNSAFLYTVNNSIGGGANLNVEALRRTMVHKYGGSTPLPRRICVNADNASDNKCWTVLLFLGMLVYHRYTNECFLSFLLVGHTHEDIDQLFSVLSRYLKRLGKVMGPNEFQDELHNAMHAAKRPAIIERIECLLDWDTHLFPHLVKPAPTGIQHATLGTKEDGDVEVEVPHLFWIHRRSDGVVVLHYKELAAHPVFLPKVRGSDPPVTDPEGIVLFGSPPPDPMVSPPTECELRSVETEEGK